MDDLFKKEQQIYNNALKHVNDIRSGLQYNADDYISIVEEYGKLLKQIRRTTKLHDKTTDNLNSIKLDLLDKIHYDALTGIYNRRFIEENFKHIVKTLSYSNSILSVIITDIDFFKKYNDTYGHSMGDFCLKSVAEAHVRSLMRTDDFAARYGGEEFVVVLPNTDEKGARLIAERLLKNVRDCGILHEKSSVSDCVTISVGITTAYVKPNHTCNDYIKRADKALYISKQSGRNKYTYLNFTED